jgi:hypothetical protein
MPTRVYLLAFWTVMKAMNEHSAWAMGSPD